MSARADNMLLADIFVERAWPHAGGKGGILLQTVLVGLFKECHAIILR
jgi:hypothetical protein